MAYVREHVELEESVEFRELEELIAVTDPLDEPAQFRRFRISGPLIGQSYMRRSSTGAASGHERQTSSQVRVVYEDSEPFQVSEDARFVGRGALVHRITPMYIS